MKTGIIGIAKQWGGIVAKLAVYLKKYRKECIIGPIFKFMEAIFELLLPTIMALIINRGVGKRDSGYVLHMGGLMVLMALFGYGCALICQYLAARASQGFGTDLRNAVFERILSYSFSQSDRFGAPTLTNRITNDINQLQTFRGHDDPPDDPRSVHLHRLHHHVVFPRLAARPDSSRRDADSCPHHLVHHEERGSALPFLPEKAGRARLRSARESLRSPRHPRILENERRNGALPRVERQPDGQRPCHRPHFVAVQSAHFHGRQP